MIEQPAPAAVRALASAIIANAVHAATSPAVTDDDRADALRFLLDPEDRRIELWTAPLGVDLDALRSRLRHRLGWTARDAA